MPIRRLSPTARTTNDQGYLYVDGNGETKRFAYEPFCDNREVHSSSECWSRTVVDVSMADVPADLEAGKESVPELRRSPTQSLV